MAGMVYIQVLIVLVELLIIYVELLTDPVPGAGACYLFLAPCTLFSKLNPKPAK
jgi:hypothetical protein